MVPDLLVEVQDTTTHEYYYYLLLPHPKAVSFLETGSGEISVMIITISKIQHQLITIICYYTQFLVLLSSSSPLFPPSRYKLCKHIQYVTANDQTNLAIQAYTQTPNKHADARLGRL